HPHPRQRARRAGQNQQRAGRAPRQHPRSVLENQRASRLRDYGHRPPVRPRRDSGLARSRAHHQVPGAVLAAQEYARQQGQELETLVARLLKATVQPSATTPPSIEPSRPLSPRIQRLFGAVQVPADFDYKKALDEAMQERYGQPSCSNWQKNRRFGSIVAAYPSAKRTTYCAKWWELRKLRKFY
nr:hypothetical protein [Tanacetum cinerariifolium]